MRNARDIHYSLRLKELMKEQAQKRQTPFWQIALLGVLIWAVLMAICFSPLLYEVVKELMK